MWNKFKESLKKTRTNLSDGLKIILKREKIDQKTLENIEELLIKNDVGVKATENLIKHIKKEKEVVDSLIDNITKTLIDCEKKFDLDTNILNIILVCGVNGGGKTTTIAKISNFLKERYKVATVAADTFRAAAIEQLEFWSKKLNIKIYKGQTGDDPASVVYKSIIQAKSDDKNVLLIDTAGRLHNKDCLMQELAKIQKVIKKIDPTAPHETLLVLDATTGSNILKQIEVFKEMLNISGIIMTKLDGTAKGGMLVNISSQYKIPIYFIGTGETLEDLQPFQANEFAKHLLRD